jgi:hypothetical protein
MPKQPRDGDEIANCVKDTDPRERGGSVAGKSGGKSPHSKLGNNCEDGLVWGGANGMILTFLQRGAQQRRAPCGTQPSPKS